MTGTTTVLFTDLVASTESLVAMGDAGVASLTDHLRMSRETVERFGGRVAKTMGDGVMALFDSSHEALGAATELQQRTHRSVGPLRLRVGVHVGELVDGDSDVFGEAVVIARRICDQAAPGKVVVSDVVRQLVGRRGSHSFVDREVVELRGFGEPTVTWTLSWEPEADAPETTVVVADDVALVRAGVARVLAESGFVVVGEGHDLESLLDACRAAEPDLLVTDIRMPPTQQDEGLQAASILRTERPELALMVLSQHVEPAAAALLLTRAPTAVGYLLKERVGDLDEFVLACRTVADGGCVIDPIVTERLTSAGATTTLSSITEAERRVLDLMTQGRSNAAIASELICSVKTVETHVRSIFTKLDLHDDPADNRRVAAVVTWLQAKGQDRSV